MNQFATGTFPDAAASTVQPHSPEIAGGQEFDPYDYLEGLGIGQLAEHEVTSHNGDTMTLVQSLEKCDAARHSLGATVDTLKDAEVEGEGVVRAMARHLERMSERARNSESGRMAESEAKKK